MNLVRYAHAPGYTAPGHEAMEMRYLQGREAGPAQAAWIGLSVVAPGGGTTLVASKLEKFYVVLDGELEVTCTQDDEIQTATLGPLDSCRVAPGEARRLHNCGSVPAKVLLVMALER